MDPLEWNSVRDAMERVPEAQENLFVLAHTLDREARGLDEEDREVHRAKKESYAEDRARRSREAWRRVEEEHKQRQRR